MAESRAEIDTGITNEADIVDIAAPESWSMQSTHSVERAAK